MVPEAVDSRLREAVKAYADADRAEALLREAHALDPHCLPVYFALYKFYFYRKRLAEAEVAALQGIEAAARQAGFATDWNCLGPQSAAWTDTAGPQHFYLFSLKALAFIRLRLGRPQEAAVLLDKLAELDPQDSVGAAVIRALAA
jgi:tetratricopeptide (TPR) repeat protein